MLQRDIDIARDLVASSDCLNQFITPMRRMRVKKAHPEFPFNVLNFAKERGECRPAHRINRLTRTCFLRPQIHSVIRRVLADQVDLSHPFNDESATFRKDLFRLPAAMFSLHSRDDAKTALLLSAVFISSIS